ncbi:YkvA family protein [Ferrimonas sp. SCSIO 43195]|uniref:YkvA family protein n=1 Tax=Ferrimonas sp. SCSIO 43195 TaxID=2822844 RepID=UPI0020750575|nr:YkvA family protein [Ferrimonas sp. SCSIO 43195]USD38430.1 DUF1232 domain-containing protein [Ferrimonas sp. SCSIO 43195]
MSNDKASGAFDTSQINASDYHESDFLDTCKKHFKAIGREALESAFRLYFALDSKSCTSKHKAVIYGALVYLVAPIDAIPDLTPMLGFTDDAGVLGAALYAIADSIDDDVKTRADEKAGEIFDSDEN